MMSDSNQKEETREPTNGKGEAEAVEQPGAQPVKRPKITLCPAMKWMQPLFGSPVVVQTVNPIWKVAPGSAILVQDSKGEIGVLGSAVPVRDDANEHVASDFFDRATIQPTNCGTRVVILQEVDLGRSEGVGKAIYIVAPEEIRSIAQVVPSVEQVEHEKERVSGSRIMVPGAPGNQPGKIVT
jgi:hypothetical protein